MRIYSAGVDAAMMDCDNHSSLNNAHIIVKYCTTIFTPLHKIISTRNQLQNNFIAPWLHWLEYTIPKMSIGWHIMHATKNFCLLYWLADWLVLHSYFCGSWIHLHKHFSNLLKCCASDGAWNIITMVKVASSNFTNIRLAHSLLLLNHSEVA